jgi:hypothetical protein
VFASYVVVFGASGLALALFGLGVDALESVLGIGAAKDRPLRPRDERRRILENAWSLVGGAVIALGLGFGIEIAVRAFFDWEQPLLGWALVAALVLVAEFGGLGIVALMIRKEAESYDVLRANLLETEGRQLTTEQLDEFRAQLERIDERHRRIRFGLRDRTRLRAVRARLDAVADEFAAVPPTGLTAVSRIRWKTANAYLWRGNPLRVVPAVFGLVVAIVLLVAEPRAAWPFALGAVVVAALAFFLALQCARLVLAKKVAEHAVNQVQRLDAVRLLEEREKTARKRTAGLGDRVTRALQILRDQQG